MRKRERMTYIMLLGLLLLLANDQFGKIGFQQILGISWSYEDRHKALPLREINVMLLVVEDNQIIIAAVLLPSRFVCSFGHLMVAIC